jgi:hypothetical protein
MARPALGRAAKSIIATVRITAREEALLRKRYGSTSKALRAFVTAEIRKDVNDEAAEDFRAGR